MTEEKNIAFSLSEQSFTQYSDMRNASAFPQVPKRKVSPTTCRRAEQPEEPYPVRPDSGSDSSDSTSSGSFKVRGDSYAQGLAHLDIQVDDERPEAHAQRLSALMLAAARSYPPPPHRHGPIVIVCSYTEFSDLAHGPRGTQAARAVRSYRLNLVDGTLTLLSAMPEGILHNPAFCRRHPKLNVLYACTESVKQDGRVAALELDGSNGALRELCPTVSAGGTSTCYLTIHHKCRRMLLVNYWDSTICTLELKPDGKLGKRLAQYDPKEGRAMKARPDKHVNHSLNDETAQAERQGDPHSHAIVLEPTIGSVAYVPDLGMDVIRQFHFDEESGQVTPCGVIPSGIKAGKRGLGPRYLIFAKDIPTCYVVNELSSQVAVFQYHSSAAEAIARTWAEAGPTVEAKTIAVKKLADTTPTLTLIQTVSTVPEAFPFEMNTCGRVTIHPSGAYVITSNRGHDSIAVHRIHRDSKPPGMLTLAGIFHTRGETPRHFQFDSSGQWLVVANQDSNTTSIFAFNTATGQITYTGNTYACPSPNFVCVWDGA